MTTTPTAFTELLDLARLEALARAATPGPWSWWTSNSTLRLTGADGRDGGVLYGYARQGDGDVNCAPNDQAFIAAANPAAVLALIALARRAQPEGEAPLRKCSKFGHRCNCAVGCDPAKPHPSMAATLSPLCGAQQPAGPAPAVICHPTCFWGDCPPCVEAGVAPSAPGTPEAPTDKHLPYWERGIATVTLNGHQLREALDFINPDGAGDPDQLDDDLTFGIVQYEDDEGKAKSGMCCWNDDTDGVLPLDSEPRAAQLDGGQEGSAT